MLHGSFETVGKDRLMGNRGPLPGKGGRPPLAQQASRKRSTQSKSTTDFAADMSSMTFERVRDLCGVWRPLSEQDEIVVSLLWTAIERHRALSAAIHARPPEEWSDGNNLSLLIRIDATEKQIASLAARFGMSPADRVRMGDDSPAGPMEATPFTDMCARAETLLA
jgi:hypothetical protein